MCFNFLYKFETLLSLQGNEQGTIKRVIFK